MALEFLKKCFLVDTPLILWKYKKILNKSINYLNFSREWKIFHHAYRSAIISKLLCFKKFKTIVIRFHRKSSRNNLFSLFIFLYIFSLFIRSNLIFEIEMRQNYWHAIKKRFDYRTLLIQCALLRSFKFSFLFYLSSFVSLSLKRTKTIHSIFLSLARVRYLIMRRLERVYRNKEYRWGEWNPLVRKLFSLIEPLCKSCPMEGVITFAI